MDENSCVFTIFGGTGDLTKRKLIPAIYGLIIENRLPKNFAVVAIGRRDLTTEIYINNIISEMNQFTRFKLDEKSLDKLRKIVYYKKLDFLSEPNSYKHLDEYIKEINGKHHTKDNRMYYLAVGPQNFYPIIKSLHDNNMIINKNNFSRIIIEKPFGNDLDSATNLNKKISKIVDEKYIFRIDHYLGKEMIRNIFAIRFSNSLFEPLWNNRYIDNVQIISNEIMGVENRGDYYESAGILKDMFQNHLLQLLTFIAMEPPVSVDSESIRDEKIKVLKSLRIFKEDEIKTHVIRGQYDKNNINGKELKGYRSEDKVSRTSNTETFVATKMFINNYRWYNVPFYIRAGKRMDEKVTKVIIEFKKLPSIDSYEGFEVSKPNTLTISIQPNEGIDFQLNTKLPGNDFKISTANLYYCQNCNIQNNSPEAYERLILESLKNNKSLFASWEEIKYSWTFVAPIEKYFRENETSFPNYLAGTRGPIEADELVEKDDRSWWY